MYNLQKKETDSGKKMCQLTSLDRKVRGQGRMSTSGAYYFLMTGADSVTLTWFRDFGGAELTQGLESQPSVWSCQLTLPSCCALVKCCD